MRGKYTTIDKDTLIKAYENNGRSMRATGKALGTSEKTVMRRMKEYDIEWDKKVFYPCNEN
jgi:transcriptional regulator of acetoin/glycerol metabolism